MPNRRDLCVRQAAFEDLPAVARIHVLSWRQAYRRQVPQDYLDSLDIAAKQKGWEDIFRATAPENRHLYVAEQGNETVGFISFGPARDKDKAGHAEIYAVYLLVGAWGAGIGRALYEKAAQVLSEAGYAKAYVWVLDTNENAIFSYRQWGGSISPGDKKQDVIGGMPVTEILLTFDLGKQ